MSKVVWFDDFNYSLSIARGERPEIATTEYGIVSYQSGFSGGQVISGGLLQDTYNDGRTGILISRWNLWTMSWSDYRPNYFGVSSKKILLEFGSPSSSDSECVISDATGNMWYDNWSTGGDSLLVEVEEPVVWCVFQIHSYDGPISYVRITTFDDEIDPPDPEPPDPTSFFWTDFIKCGERP